MKIIAIDLDRCLGCRNCEWACSFYGTGGFNREESNIWVNLYPEERFIATLACVQCENPPCLRICPTKALRRNARTDAVVIDESRCLGCKVCMQVCPFGNIHFSRRKRTAQKCNLCDGDPKCVKFCMVQALTFVEVNDIAETKRKTVDHRLRKLLTAPFTGAEK